MLEPAAGMRDPVSLAGHLAARCVPNVQESVEEVATMERAGEFIALPNLLNRGYTDDICWLRFELQRDSDAPDEWLLEVGQPILDDVVLYAPRPSSAGTTFSAIRLGDRQPYAERPVPHRRFIFPLQLPETESAIFYLRIRTSSTMQVDTIRVWQYPGLLRQTQRESALSWGVSGIIILGALSNLVFWFWLRERVHGLYTSYLTALFLLTQSNSGLIAQWLLPNYPMLADRLMGVVTSITLLVGLLFFDEVLGLRRHFPRTRRLFPVAVAVYASTAIFSIFGHYEKMVGIQQPMALLITLGITLAGPWLIWRGVPNLRLYTLAFSTQLVTAIAVIARNVGLWVTTIPLDDVILGATTVHVVLLNFLLADRVRKTQQDRADMEKYAARLESEQLALNQQHEFMSMVAHEFRTPLAIIDTSAQRIAEHPQANTDKIIERCANIRAAVQRQAALMDEFLTLDRMEGQIRRFSPVPCRVDDIVDAVLAEFPLRRIDVERRSVPDSIICDPTMLRVALGNLLNNALRFSTPDRQVRLSVDRRTEGMVTFSISDDGPGIPVDELPKLFQKYFRGRISQSQPGAGLGLYLVDQVAKLHGGSVSVSSRQGEGSSFELMLPG